MLQDLKSLLILNKIDEETYYLILSNKTVPLKLSEALKEVEESEKEFHALNSEEGC